MASLMALSWLVAGVLYAALSIRCLNSLRIPRVDFTQIRHLAVFGGWISISNLLTPVFVYFDRFLIGSLISLAAVGFYTVPYDMTVRLGIIPGSLAMTLFPAFSALSFTVGCRNLSTLFRKSLQYVALIVSPIVLVLAIFAHLLLRIWLGTEFATQSTLVLQTLSVGILFNSLAFIPVSLLQGIGRPDIPSKLLLIELPFYIGAAWVLTKHFGIAGAATASCLRNLGDCALLVLSATRVLREQHDEQTLSEIASA
jgi:O-antigen/teichoic acid export membrane protein